MLNCNCLTATGYRPRIIIHINAFLAYLLVQELFFDKNHFVEFLSVGCNVALQQLNIFAATHSTNIIQTFHACPWATRKRKRLALRVILWRNFTNVTNRTKIFYFIALLISRKFSNQTYRNGPKNLSRVSSIPFQYVRARGAVPQKFIYISKITNHHFPG